MASSGSEGSLHIQVGWVESGGRGQIDVARWAEFAFII